MTGKHETMKPRAAAIAAGLASYNTGKPCKHGHLSDRDWLGHCIACAKRKTPSGRAVMRSSRSSRGFVYIVSASNGYLKIGKASNPYERFSNHQTSSPLPLTLDYIVGCAIPVDIEAAAHHTLAPYRRHREWFEVDAQAAIDAVRAAVVAAGYSLVDGPHRPNQKIGSRLVHRASIVESAEPSVPGIPIADGLIGHFA